MPLSDKPLTRAQIEQRVRLHESTSAMFAEKGDLRMADAFRKLADEWRKKLEPQPTKAKREPMEWQRRAAGDL